MLIHDSDGDNDDDGDDDDEDDGDDDGDDGDDLSSWHTQATHVGHPSCHPAPSNLSLGIPQAIFHESGEIKPSWQPISLHHRQIVKIMFSGKPGGKLSTVMMMWTLARVMMRMARAMMILLTLARVMMMMLTLARVMM